VADNFELLDQVYVRNDDVRRSSDIGVNDAVVEIELRTVFLTVERRIRKAGTGQSHVSFHATDVSILRG
jgi:hypothetical protein